MGLEHVELVMDVEREFGISLPDTLASEARTVGQMYDAILPIVRLRGTEVIRGRSDLDDFVWVRLRQLAASLGSVDASTVTRDTRYTEDLGYG